jgi:hypothetical protein
MRQRLRPGRVHSLRVALVLVLPVVNVWMVMG